MCVCVCVCVCAHVRICECMYVRMYMYLCVCVCVCERERGETSSKKIKAIASFLLVAQATVRQPKHQGRPPEHRKPILRVSTERLPLKWNNMVLSLQP